MEQRTVDRVLSTPSTSVRFDDETSEQHLTRLFTYSNLSITEFEKVAKQSGVSKIIVRIDGSLEFIYSAPFTH